jgi:two-component sensor histidine kinase
MCRSGIRGPQPARCANVSGQALRSSGLVIGDYTAGRTTGLAILPLALAVRDHAGRVTGVLVAPIELRWLSEELKKRGVPPDGSVTVADRHGVIIARQPLPERFVGTRIPDAFMRLVDAPAPGAETVMSQDGTLRVLGYVPISLPPVGVYVSAGLSAEASYVAVDRAARIGAFLAICGGLATILATWIVGSRLFIEPLQEIKRVLDEWRGGARNARTGLEDNAGEIGALGAALDRMMDDILESQEHRDLLANELAHRVKNTLATVQAPALSTLESPFPRVRRCRLSSPASRRWRGRTRS